MGIRIDRISINRGGPLKDDFILEPQGLNLIYGLNETGKTYLVEAMLNFLFKIGNNTPWILKRTKSQEPTVRDWKPGGKILISGLEDKTTTFTSGGIKLEDFRSSDSQLPEELSRLMVVRAGDTRLSSAGDGVGDSILRTCLSGKGVLDEIEKRIQKNVRKATIENGNITMTCAGLQDDRLKSEKKKNDLEALQLQVDENASLGSINTLERTRDRISEQLKELEDAKRHRAFRLNEELRKLELDMEDLPSEQDLRRLGTDISLYGAECKKLSDIEEELDNTADEEDNYIWVNKAKDEYLTHAEVQRNRSLKDKVNIALLFFFILLTAAVGFFSGPLMIAVAAAGAVISLMVHLRNKSEPVSASAGLRQEKLEEEFSRRFQRKLTDSATLHVEFKRLETAHIRSENQRKDGIELKQDIETKKSSILSRFYAIAGENIPGNEWDFRIEEIRKNRKEIQETISSTNMSFASLNVQEDSFLPDPPSEEWDKSRHLKVQNELEDVLKNLEREKHSIDNLKMEIKEATGSKARDIKELLTALEDSIETAENEYKDYTAHILAENNVYRAVCDLRSQENERLDEALGSDEVVSALLKITGHYNGLKMDSDGYLHLSTPEDDEYPLSQLSTGAAEQVYIALRTGFAELTMGGTAFLVFDDAFQHSDWERRKNLVNHVIKLVKSGWQVFYFTMDDHLKKLFDKSGKDIGQAGYTSTRLN